MAGGETGKSDQPTHLAQPWMEFVQAALRAACDFHRVLARVSGGWHLSDMELMLLWSCAQPAPAGGHSETELAEPLGLTSSQWSAALYDLRDRGLLSFQRVPDGDERRPLTITPLGRAALEDVSRALAPLAAVWNSEVGESELRDCVQLLRRLSDISSSSRLERVSGGAPVVPPRWTRLHRGAA
ncbi:MAG: MarR family winged helix-turn-helix transcriptional regulator [Pirellulales bacterium]